LGETTARHLASKGNVVLGARREDKLEQIAERSTRQGKEKLYLKTDVTKKDEVQALVDKAVQEFGKLDVIINNAGLMSIANE
jgi:NADP-dependent 3-hydroxy acid dehydrogenase YdfG